MLKTIFWLTCFVLSLVLFLAGVAHKPQVFDKPRLVHIPKQQALLVEKHLRSIVDKDWAKVVPGDLYHAHILLSPKSRTVKQFGSLEELFSYAVAILYHSDEMLVRWRLTDGDLPTEKKRPRSIIGYPDGRIIPAASLLANPLETARHYSWHGTIHTDDLAVELPDFVDMRRDVLVALPSGACFLNLIIDIGLGYPPDPTILVEGDNLKITMDCMYP